MGQKNTKALHKWTNCQDYRSCFKPKRENKQLLLKTRVIPPSLFLLISRSPWLPVSTLQRTGLQVSGSVDVPFKTSHCYAATTSETKRFIVLYCPHCYLRDLYSPLNNNTRRAAIVHVPPPSRFFVCHVYGISCTVQLQGHSVKALRCFR